MSRFNSSAYDKLFPREPEPAQPVETAVETFTPTKDKLEGQPEKETVIPEVPEDPIEPVKEVMHDGGLGEPDPEQ